MSEAKKRNPETIEVARQRLLQVVPHLRYAMKLAVKEAGVGGAVEIGLLAIPADNQGGRVVARFNAGEFWEDLAAVIDAPDESEETQSEAQAQHIVDTIRAMGGTIVDSSIK